MQKITRSRSMLLGALTALLVVFMAGETLAFWSQELWADNEFQLGRYDTKIVEKFQSPNNWRPGLAVNKEVKIANQGSVPIFAKTRINMNWIRLENVYDGEGNIVLPAKGDSFSLTFAADAGGNQEYGALINWSSDVILFSPGKAADRSLRLGLPHVSTAAQAAGKWLLLNETPDVGGNLTFYYIGILQPGEQTPPLIDSVMMNPKIQASTLKTHTTYDRERQEWVTEHIMNATHSYENARFTLTVNAATVQAASDAVQDIFTGSTTQEQAVITHLASIGIDPADAAGTNNSAAEQNTLYFEGVNGEMQYTPVRNGNRAWFMSVLNMIPGGHYSDELLIENLSKKTYDLYTQVMPRDNQTILQDELLELISMKVYYWDELVYDGTALGKEYAGSLQSLQNVVFLGTFVPNAKHAIRVELELSKDTPLAYCDLLTMIDWKFMAAEIDTPPGPQTGDNAKTMQYLALMLMTAAGFATCIILLARAHKQVKPNKE